MSGMQKLVECAGKWQGTNCLQDPTTGAPEDSVGTLTVTPILRGKFVRLEYTWVYQGTEQDGVFLMDCKSGANAVTACWADTWHMSDKFMICTGTVENDGSITVVGHYAAPPGPDWGWRTVIRPAADNGSLQMTMYNVTPDGEAELAVEANYNR